MQPRCTASKSSVDVLTPSQPSSCAHRKLQAPLVRRMNAGSETWYAACARMHALICMRGGCQCPRIGHACQVGDVQLHFFYVLIKQRPIALAQEGHNGLHGLSSCHPSGDEGRSWKMLIGLVPWKLLGPQRVCVPFTPEKCDHRCGTCGLRGRVRVQQGGVRCISEGYAWAV